MKTNKDLLIIAKDAANNAYCPYSHFEVGAVSVFDSSNFYTGCNVENSSYGLSLCAERNSLSSAVSHGETSKLIKIAVFSPKAKLCFPCGACLQWIKEFSKGFNTEIILEDKNGKEKIFYINDLLPYPFSAI